MVVFLRAFLSNAIYRVSMSSYKVYIRCVYTELEGHMIYSLQVQTIFSFCTLAGLLFAANNTHSIYKRYYYRYIFSKATTEKKNHKGKNTEKYRMREKKN